MLIETLASDYCSRREAAKAFGLDEYVLNNFISKRREILELKNGDYIITSKHTKIIKKRNKDEE